MKRFAMALVLVCALSTSIFAGNMPTGGRSEEPPPPTTTSSTSSTLLVTVILTIIGLK
ncbi:MAG TPA: hypothetical protein VE980_22945 [Pyrinomonadaceae bacterium]|nr:hypothetical protein [Pyrinomonadaceae bacterium]